MAQFLFVCTNISSWECIVLLVKSYWGGGGGDIWFKMIFHTERVCCHWNRQSDVTWTRPPSWTNVSARVEKKILPGPVGVAFRPLLLTTRDSGLVGRVVLLVTDQIRTAVLGIFLNNCHSRWGLSQTAPAKYDFLFLSLSFVVFWSVGEGIKKGSVLKAGKTKGGRRVSIFSLNVHSEEEGESLLFLMPWEG